MKGKTATRVFALALLVCVAVTVLAGCSSGLSGTYKNEFSGISITFKLGGKAEFSTAEVKVGDTVIVEAQKQTGTYKIEDGKIIFDFGEDSTMTGESTFEKKDGDLIIDGFTFEKQ